jgi:glucosamine--fructose-6-phosphate aminotransferase (isomerizing)
MKSLGNFPDPFIAEISGQPDAIRRAGDGLADQREALERPATLAREGALVFTGMGSSYDACYPAVTGLAAVGVPALHVDTSELLHFRRNLLPHAAVLVAVSQSGESAEVVRLIEELRSGDRAPLVVAVTNGTASTLAGLADAVLDTRAGDEVGPSTMTFAAALVVLAAVGRVLQGESPARAVDEVRRGAVAAASSLERLLAQPGLPHELAAWLGGRPTSVILGRGPARAAAEMGALTLKEAVGMPIESLQTAQFRHGPLELAGPDLAAMVIATEPQTRDLDVGLTGELAELGASALAVVEGGDTPEGVMRIEIGEQDRMLAPSVSVLPAQLLAWKLAVDRGRPPGSYVRASKVTTRE